MKLTYSILLGIIVLITIGTLLIIVPENKKIRYCEDTNYNSPELTFEMSYCSGDKCATTCDENDENCYQITTEEECTKIDVVLENDISKFYKDGLADCEWINNNCVPNK